MKMPKGQFGRKPLKWDPLPYMEDYLEELRARDNTEGYINAVRKSLAHFAIFAEGQDLEHPAEIERKHILRFQAYINSKDFKKSYAVQLQKYLRTWVRWLHDTEILNHNPWFNISVGGYSKEPNPLSDEAMERLFATHRSQAFSMPPFLWHRQEVILTLLYAWGLRIHELEALNVTNVDTRLDFVKGINKGGGTKTLPYSSDLKAIVSRYLRVRAEHTKIGEDALIVTQQGDRLTTDGIRRVISDLGDRAGVKVNPHRLRDTFGTNMLDEDMAVERLSKIMGHTNTKQTLAYSRVNDKKVAEDHERAISKRLEKLLPNLRRTQGETNG